MVYDMEEIRDMLRAIDLKYYDNLALDERQINDEFAIEIIVDNLKKAEKEFKKGTKDGNKHGIVYRGIAKGLLDSL
jgi:hypothetical protein